MRLDGRFGEALSLLAGFALPLAYAPFELFPLAPVSLAALFLSWLHASPRRAFLRGWLYGLGAFGFGVSWIHESFQFNHIALAYAVVLTAILVAGMALYPALAGYLARRFGGQHEGYQLLGIMPATWVGLEWLRGWLFTGVTWLQLGYSQVDSPLKGLLPVAGIYAVSWLVAISAGLLLLIFRNRGPTRWLSLVGLIWLWIAVGLLGLAQWTTPEGKPIRVALVQGNVAQDQKWRAEMREPTLERYLSLTRKHWDADLVVWPETALPGLRDALAPFIDQLAAEARAHDTDVVFGVPVLDRDTQRFFNSVYVVGGRKMGYHKRHLLPFGEYLPLEGLLRPVTDALGIPVADFSPGPDAQPLLQADGKRLGLSICYEIAFGNEILRAVPEADLLVTVSNDAWFGESIGPHQHMQMARARALETGRYLLRATNTGITAIVGPDGVTQSRAPQFQVHVLTGEVKAMIGATPYAHTGDTAIVVIIALALVASVMGSRGWRRRVAER